MHRALLLVLLFTLACGTKSKGTAPVACQKFGDTCEYSPGKLGTCVELTQCEAGKSCLTCQSQH